VQIPVLVEFTYRKSIWAEQILEGLTREASHRKYKLQILQCEQFSELDQEKCLESENGMIVILGTTLSWMNDAMEYFNNRKISVISVGYAPLESASLLGIVRMDYISALDALFCHLMERGCSRIAIYGVNVNSSADLIKRDHFSQMCQNLLQTGADNVFNNVVSLEQCYNDFHSRIHEFDAVICTNDITAVSLLIRLRKDGIRVPEDLKIASFGNSLLTERTHPTITTASLDHVEMGRQAVKLYAWLYHQEVPASVSVRVRSKLTARQSTESVDQIVIDEKICSGRMDAMENIDIYMDEEVNRIMRIETLINACDKTDVKYCRGLIRQQSTTVMQEELFLSQSALRYRLKKIMTVAGCDTPEELREFLLACDGLGLFAE